MSDSSLQKVQSLAYSGEMIIFHFQVKALYDEHQLEELLETIDRRGASCTHKGDGRFRCCVPITLPWIPFYQTIRDCQSVQLTDVTTVSQRRTILIEPEG